MQIITATLVRHWMNKDTSFPSSQQGFQAACVVRWRKRCPVALFKFFCRGKTSMRTSDGLVPRVKYLHGIPWKSMEIYGNPWNSMEIDGNPWNSTKLPWSIHGVSMEFHGMPWSSTEYPWSSMECHGVPRSSIWSSDGVPWNAMKFHGISWSSIVP